MTPRFFRNFWQSERERGRRGMLLNDFYLIYFKLIKYHNERIRHSIKLDSTQAPVVLVMPLFTTFSGYFLEKSIDERVHEIFLELNF